MDAEAVLATVQKHQGKRGALISILEEVQAKHGYLPAEALRAVAAGMGRPLVDVYGVATFYKAFSLRPRGKHLCSVCLGTACHVRGGPAVAAEFERQLKVPPGETTADKEMTLTTVNCLGACALGPIVVVDGHYFSNVSAARVAGIVEQARRGIDRTEVGDETVFPIEVSCPRCNHSLMDAGHPLGGRPSIGLVASADAAVSRLRLSSWYGLDEFETSPTLAPGTIAGLYCPHCHGELAGRSACLLCEAPFVPLAVSGGAILQTCARIGCSGRLLDLSGINL